MQTFVLVEVDNGVEATIYPTTIAPEGWVQDKPFDPLPSGVSMHIPVTIEHQPNHKPTGAAFIITYSTSDAPHAPGAGIAITYNPEAEQPYAVEVVQDKDSAAPIVSAALSPYITDGGLEIMIVTIT